MSDLIERLRGPCPSIPAMRDAANEIERLTAENKMLRHTHRWNVSPQVDDSLLVCRGLHEKDEKCDLEHYVPAGRLHDAIRERDELRRQLDPMGEYASAEELIAALRAEKAEDEAMKRDAECWRELDRMMSDPDARLNVNAGGWAVLKCGLLGKLGGDDA